MKRREYANRLSMRRGWPIKVHNRRSLQTQMQCEGGGAKYNPFNTIQPMPNSTFYNVLMYDGNGKPLYGVQNYQSAKEGLDAIEKTFDRNPDFDPVDRALKRNEPARVTTRLMGESPWGTAPKLLAEVLAWIAHVPGVLWLLEQKEVAS